MRKQKHEDLGKRKSLHSPRDNNEGKRVTCTEPNDQANKKSLMFRKFKVALMMITNWQKCLEL
jgi:hypothetical protein